MGVARMILSIGGLLMALICSGWGDVSVGNTKGEKKIKILRSRGPLVTLTDSNFTRFAVTQPRPYHLVLIFTATEPKFGCTFCRSLLPPIEEVAQSNAYQNGQNDEETPLVFAVIDLHNGRSAFEMFGMQSVPHAFLIPSDHQVQRNSLRLRGSLDVTQFISIPPGQPGSQAPSSKVLAEELTHRTGVEIVIHPDMSGFLAAVPVVAAVLGVLGHIIISRPARIMGVARSRGLWMLFTLACFASGVGGMIYCIIRKPRTHTTNQDGNWAMFSDSSREQFWYEGFAVVSMYLAMGAGMIGLQKAATWKSAPSVVRSTAALVCVTFLCFLMKEYFYLYVKKTPWYTLDGFLPSTLLGFHKGPIKRSDGLLRRICRVSHIWLNEYTTGKAMGKKFKTLVVDFVVRKAARIVGLKKG
ncbi:unnamed protein product [Choristocarpus tenellus]